VNAFLILMYLLSLCLGYATAFDGSTRALWDSIRNNDMPGTLQLALNPPWERRLVYATYSASVLGILYGFWKYGFFPGTGIAFCFIVASKIGEMFLLHKMHSTFHLNIIVRAVLRRQADYMRSGDMERAKSMECLIEKLALKLHAMKARKSATLVPVYGSHLEHLKIAGAKADNYLSCRRSKKET